MKNRTFRYFQNVTCLNLEDNLFPSISLKVQKQKFPVRGCNATCSDINYRTRRSARFKRRKASSVLFLFVTQQGPTFPILGQHHVIPNLDLLNQTPGWWVCNKKPGTDRSSHGAFDRAQRGGKWWHQAIGKEAIVVVIPRWVPYLTKILGKKRSVIQGERSCAFFMSSVPLYSYPWPWYKLTNTGLQKSAVFLSGVLSSCCNRILHRGILSLWIFPLPTLSMP